MTDASSSPQETLVVSPEDRLFDFADPFWRAARRRFPHLLVAVLLLHLTVLALLILIDQPDKEAAPAEKEIPVQVIVQPPPPPPPPPPKPEQKKPEPKPKQPPPKPQYEKEEKPAFDAPRAANQETIKREALDDRTRSPLKAPPTPANDTKPTPNAPKPAQDAAPEAADQTTSPEVPKDEKDAEALNKAAPIKDKKAAMRMRKIGAAFSSSANIGGGNETTILNITHALLIHGMVIQGDPQGDHYGPVSIGKPDDRVIDQCKRRGKRIAELTKKHYS